MRFGMDFGGTNVKTGLFSEEGDVGASGQVPLADLARGDLVPNLLDLARTTVGSRRITAGGLAVKGLVDSTAGRVLDDVGAGTMLAGVDLRAAFADALGVPFAVDNDARCYAWGEWRFGAGRGATVMACLTLGTGIGCSLVAHGRPYAGSDPLGGILGGHLCIDRNGPDCLCGQRGCFELYCSATAMAERVAVAHAGLPTDATLPAFFEGVRGGRPGFAETLDALLDDLAIGVVNVIHAYGPDRVVLGGGVMESADAILPGLTERVHRRAWTVPRSRVEVVAARLGYRAAALGAAFHPTLG